MQDIKATDTVNSCTDENLYFDAHSVKKAFGKWDWRLKMSCSYLRVSTPEGVLPTWALLDWNGQRSAKASRENVVITIFKDYDKVYFLHYPQKNKIKSFEI